MSDTATIAACDIMSWLDHPSGSRGIRFADDDDWTFCSYAELAELTRRAAADLRAAGVDRDDVVMIVSPDAREFVTRFFGALYIGATPAPAAGPAAFQRRDTYAEHLGRILRLIRPAAIAAPAEISHTVAGHATDVGAVVVTGEADRRKPVTERCPPPDIGLVQLSSGSTDRPKGIRIPWQSVNANVASIHEWTGWRNSDAVASWLPFHHDMGLIGGLLVPMAGDNDLWLMSPRQFIRSPSRWLSLFSEHRVTMGACPTFGLAHVVRRTRPAQLAGLDLSSWRTLIVGAERVDHAVVQSFTELLTPHGFDPEAVMPAYGLAEVTLAATGVRAGEGVRTIRADSRSLAVGREVGIAASDQPGFELVGCGAPLAGMAVRVVDGSGEAVPDGVLGEIEVRGPSVALGYVGDDHDEQFLDGAVRTGDAGFLDAGQLYVVGRLGESVKHLGRWVFPEDLERAAREASARPLRTTVLLGTVGSQDMAVVIAEAIDAEAAAQIGSAVAQQPHNLRVVVRRAPPGWIQRTTSGKPMRRAMWQQLITSHENTPVLWDTARA